MDNLGGRGVALHPVCNPTSIEKRGEGDLLLHYTDAAGAALSLPCSMVMLATGARAAREGRGVWEGFRGAGGRKGAGAVGGRAFRRSPTDG